VDRPSRQEDGVAGFRREAREATGHRSVRERLPQIGFRGAWLQACIDAAVWPRLQHDPRFGFAGLARWQQVRVRIRGMNLHREQLTCVEELQQQRESAEIARPAFPLAVLETVPSVERWSAFEGAIGNAARMVVAVAQYPRFADRAVARQRCREQTGQTPAAPQPIPIDGRESQGIESALTHGLSAR